jgi:PAS domain S-box-containing protein
MKKAGCVNKPFTRSSSLEEECQYKHIFDSVSDGLVLINLETRLLVEANPALCKMYGYSHEEIIGLPLITLIHPDDQKEFLVYFRAFKPDSSFDIRIRNICKDGSLFHSEWHGSTIIFQDQPCLLGVVRDISSRIQAEETLHQRVETRTHEQATLLKISHTLASTLEFQPGLILDQLHEIIEYTRGGLFALEDSTLVALAVRGAHNLVESPPFRIHLQGPQILETLFTSNRPVRIVDVWNDQPQAQFLRSLLNEPAGLLEGIQSWMWVPLTVRGNIIGVVGIAGQEKSFFTGHHADLALSVANQAAITMVNADLNKQAQELAVLEERQRLARNLHDAVNQSLFSAGLIAEVLPRLWERDRAEALRSLEDLRRLTRGAQAEMRALLAELRPSTITDSNLVDLLRLLGNALSGRTSIPVDVTTSGEFSLPADVQITFYRVCQETLNNVAKHSKASHVQITLNQDGNLIELHIKDDGRGFDPLQTISGHYGLGMMRERAENVGAQFSIISQPGQGSETLIRWIHPTQKDAQ